MFFSALNRKPKKITKSKSCTGKSKMYEASAKTKAAKLRGRGIKMRAYRCRYCKFPNGKSAWHVGHHG